MYAPWLGSSSQNGPPMPCGTMRSCIAGLCGTSTVDAGFSLPILPVHLHTRLLAWSPADQPQYTTPGHHCSPAWSTAADGQGPIHEDDLQWREVVRGRGRHLYFRNTSNTIDRKLHTRL